MFPSALDDLVEDDESLYQITDPLEEHSRYLARYRRVRVGPSAVVVFENRRTLKFRVQELVRVGQATHPDRVRGAMDWYRSLLPGAGRMLASITIRDRAHRPFRASTDAASVYLRAGDHRIPGATLADTGGDRLIGLVRWVEFRFTAADRAVLANLSNPLVLGLIAADERHESPPLDATMRSSLLADLALGSPANN